MKIYKGNIVFSKDFGKYDIYENGYIAVEDEKVKEVYSELPEDLKNSDIEDYGDKIIIPAFSDIHLHAPQFVNRGLGMDKELLDWLEIYTFPEEAKYSDIEYAEKAYRKFVKELWKYGTLNAVVFATISRESTELLMEIMDDYGINGYAGKVNMDRNSPDFYIEETSESIEETEKFIKNTLDKFSRVKPIITPRFVPTCTAELMTELGKLAEKYDLKVQSHLSENRGEVEWVKELHPEASSYYDVYRKYGMIRNGKTVMAHCVWNTDEETEGMKEDQAYVAHCPYSNTNLSSGIAPIRKYVEKGVPVGLGSDVSGGHQISIASVISIAAQVSKMRWVYVNSEEEALNAPELFYLATKGGGSFFGNTGSFEEGYYFDALVIDDSSLDDMNPRSIEERMERYFYLGDDRNIVKRFSSGRELKEPEL